MIQMCSQCGTRWNVRDRRRTWCPRCQGALLEPTGTGSEWSARPTASALGAGAQPASPRLPPGFRWIAVRPGAAPPRRRRSGGLGPTPRYDVIPRWGLHEHFETPATGLTEQRAGPSVVAVRATLIATMVVLGFAALVHVVRYALLLINRTVLLNVWVAGAATWLGVVASVAAMFAVVASAVLLTNWLMARRAAAFAHLGRAEPRSVWALRAGCLVPLVNLFFAPVYLFELAHAEGRTARLRRPIVLWWTAFLASTAVSVFAFFTSFTTDAQGIADNTVTTTVAYLLALAALLLATQVFLGFETTTVDRPSKRWVMVAEEDVPAAESKSSATEAEMESAAAVEAKGQNPAA